MSKFLKFIIHLVVLLTIVDILALALPPFFGVTTAIIDSPDKSGNLPLGSVTYAESVSVEELQEGDSILVQDGDGNYRYRINSIDTANGVYNVYDQSAVENGEQSLSLRNTAQRIVITIGFIGYLIIAVQSTEGLVIIGLVVVFLIILFILSELWRKDKKNNIEEMEGNEAAVPDGTEVDENAPAKTKRQLKKEAKLRAKEEKRAEKLRDKQELEEATTQLKAEAKARKKAEKEKRKRAKKMTRTGGFIEDYEPIEATAAKNKSQPVKKEPQVVSVQREDVVADEANEELRKEVAAAVETQSIGETREVVLPGENRIAEEVPVMENVQAVSAQNAVSMEEEAAWEEPVEIKKMAIPVYTEEELLSKARAAGETPKVVRDERVGVTLLDYSDIIIEGTASSHGRE